MGLDVNNTDRLKSILHPHRSQHCIMFQHIGHSLSYLYYLCRRSSPNDYGIVRILNHPNCFNIAYSFLNGNYH